jgi:hypothetical protein
MLHRLQLKDALFSDYSKRDNYKGSFCRASSPVEVNLYSYSIFELPYTRLSLS